MEDENNKTKVDLIKQKLKNNNVKNKNNLHIFCCCKLCSSCYKKMKECSSKISILTQFIIYFVPVILIIVAILIFIHLYFFSDIYKFDFYTIIKEEFLRYFITDLDDINFGLNQRRTSLLFEDISNLVFFKIYFDELSTYGLFDTDKEKIFPNVSNIDENIYESLEQYNTIFSIPKKMSKDLIDSRNDSLSEVYKLYYYFYPLIATEANSAKTFINQTFLISYPVNENNDISGNVLFFNFPRISEDFIQNNNNFYPYNNLIAPRISDCQEYEKYKNPNDTDEVYTDNWFIYFDCLFRKEPKLSFYLNFFHLNENNKGNINKTNVVTMQTQIYNNEKQKFILDFVFFLNQKNLAKGASEDSVFLVFNSTNNIFRKFSDYQTFVINNNDITEIALSTHLNKYFHYGLNSYDDNFFSDGIFYDNIDINQLAEPSNKYTTIDGFDFDIRYFSSYYLYSKLFVRSQFTEEYMETDNIYYYIFNNSQEIKNVCKQFNFGLYIKSLEKHNFDCFNDKNLLYYSKKNINSFFAEGLTLPYCICLPLYCIKNLKKDLDINNIEFADEIILPEKCQNNLLHFDNGVNEDNEEKNSSKADLSSIQLKFAESLEEYLENQYIKFSFEKKNLNGGLSYVFISVISNDDMKTLLVDFVERFNQNSVKIILIFVFGTFIIFIVFSILIIIYIYSISKVIYEYKEKAYLFLNKLADSSKNKSQKNSDDKNNYELSPLLLEEINEKKIIEENELVNDLYKIYCKFYSTSENSNLHNNKSFMKISKLKESNELFKLFLKLSLYMPQFKLDINIDHDFYKDSKLIKNIDNNFSKKLNMNEYKEQILYTKSIVKELLSTELVEDYGLITNLNFNYMTNINLGENNYVQKAIFKKVEEMKKKQFKEGRGNKDLNIDNIKIVFKNKNIIMKKIEEKFEQDDYLNLNKLDSYFNNTLINSYYNYMKRIITDK